MNKKIILASASPRRKELLKIVVPEFEIETADADEERIDKGIPVHLYVQELALLKAAAVVKKTGRRRGTLVIGADTVVFHNEKILGKPKDGEDAFDMLCALSGDMHSVYTGVCVMDPYTAEIVCRYSKTDVYFKELDPDDVMGYIKGGEPMDKAGAYGIQGKGGLFVKKIDGDYQNVVGLPVSLLSDILKEDFDMNLINL